MAVYLIIGTASRKGDGKTERQHVREEVEGRNYVQAIDRLRAKLDGEGWKLLQRPQPSARWLRD